MVETLVFRPARPALLLVVEVDRTTQLWAQSFFQFGATKALGSRGLQRPKTKERMAPYGKAKEERTYVCVVLLRFKENPVRKFKGKLVTFLLLGDESIDPKPSYFAQLGMLRDWRKVTLRTPEHVHFGPSI